jgi:dipeptidyl aminopeptidase/acylaminoacyl peptidase
MKRMIPALAAAGFVVAGVGVLALQSGASAAPKPGAAYAQKGAGALTIDKLIDIRMPTNPVWSRDSRRIAFLWERAGISNLYVVPADGSAKPVAITTEPAAMQGLFWGNDNKTIYFTRGGTLMQIAAEAGQTARPVWPRMPGRGLALSPDGGSVAYIVGGPPPPPGTGGGRGAGARGATAEPPAPAGAAASGPAEIRVRTFPNGAERTVATFNGPVAAVTWAPDGARLTFTSGGGGGQSIRHESSPEYSGAKIVYLTTQNVPGQPADTYLVSLTPSTGSGQAPATGASAPVKINVGTGGGGRGGGGPRWLDETRVVFDRQGGGDFKRRSIFVQDVTGGEPKLVHEDIKSTFWSIPGGAGAGSQVSPAGKFFAFLSDRDGWDHLYVASASSAPVQITKGQFEVWRPVWSPDGTRIAYDFNEASNHGTRHIGLVTINDSPETARIRPLTSGRGADVNPVWSPDGRLIVYQRSDAQNPADLYVVGATTPGTKPVRLTDSLPAGVDRARLVAPELVHYPGPDGKPVPAYLFVPKTLNKALKHPAVVWVHGDGVNQNYDGWHIQRNYAVYYSFHQYLLQQGFVVIAPDYRGSIGYGAAWRDGVYMDVGGKDFKDAGMAADYLKKLPYVDANRLGIWGLSYGGFFTLLAMTDMPTTYRAAVNVAGVADYAMYYEDPYRGAWTESRIGQPQDNPAVYAQASPLSRIDKLQRPLLVLHGTADVNVPYLHSVRLVDELMKKGKGNLVEFMMYPGELHYFTREHVLRDAWTRVERFFKQHLKP